MPLSRSQFRTWKRWLPLALLLVLLAQLSAATHAHPDSSHSLVDCSLCLQQHGHLDGHSGPVLPTLPTTVAGAILTALPVVPALRALPAPAIRGPPPTLC